MPTDEPTDALEVRPLGRQDLREVADLHRAALPPSFFSRLGPRFLRAYYETYVSGPDAVALAAVRGPVLCGFVVGSAAAHDHAAWTARRRGLRLAVVGLASMAVRPRVAREFLRTRTGRYVRGLARRLRHRPAGAAAERSRPAAGTGQPAVLAHVAVHRHCRGGGVGELLVRRFAAELAGRGAPRLELVTLAGPDGASAFYERLGLEPAGQRVDGDGRRWQSFQLATTAPGE